MTAGIQAQVVLGLYYLCSTKITKAGRHACINYQGIYNDCCCRETANMQALFTSHTELL